jgi:hypothetical protein
VYILCMIHLPDEIPGGAYEFTYEYNIEVLIYNFKIGITDRLYIYILYTYIFLYIVYRSIIYNGRPSLLFYTPVQL